DREHPAEGVRILRELGVPNDVCEAILGHAPYTGVPRSTLLARTLFAVDELTGLITACALVKPSRSVHDVDVRSVRKKMKDKAFARGVSREDIALGVQELEGALGRRIATGRGAMQAVAEASGLSGGCAARLRHVRGLLLPFAAGAVAPTVRPPPQQSRRCGVFRP